MVLIEQEKQQFDSLVDLLTTAIDNNKTELLTLAQALIHTIRTR
jgi:Trp operon repressor